MITDLHDEASGFRPPASMTPGQVGDHLARLVWESLSDFIIDGDAEALLGGLGLTNEHGIPANATAEEVLIFFMWAHTRGLQLAFLGRAPDERVRQALDAFHAAIFEDMVAQGTSRAELPLFEQRVSARYADYHAAAERSDSELGDAVGRAVTGDGLGTAGLGPALARHAIAVVDPLRDYLVEVELQD